MTALEERNVQSKATITVRRTKIDNVLEDSFDEETITVRKFQTEPAYVSVRAGLTLNRGNYESLRLDIGVKIPCYVEEISEIEKQASDWVDVRMSEKLDEINAKRNIV